MSGFELLRTLYTLSRARITCEDGAQPGADGLLLKESTKAWE